MTIRGDFLKILGIFTEGKGQSAIFEVKSGGRMRKIPEGQGNKPKTQVRLVAPRKGKILQANDLEFNLIRTGYNHGIKG